MIYLCYAIMIVVPYLLCGINSAIIVTKIKTGEDISKEYGIPIVNKRISVTPIAMMAAAFQGRNPNR